MTWRIIFDAIALMLVLEGLCPFLNPTKYRQLLAILLAQSSSRMRATGLTLMIVGLLIAVVVHSL